MALFFIISGCILCVISLGLSLRLRVLRRSVSLPAVIEVRCETVPISRVTVAIADTWADEIGWLVPLDGDQRYKTLILRPGRTTIGSGPASDIVINDPTVSSGHCEINQTAEGFTIVDRGSRNGLYVNGARVDRFELCDHDKIVLGTTTLRFLTAPLQARRPSNPAEALAAKDYDTMPPVFVRAEFPDLSSADVEVGRGYTLNVSLGEASHVALVGTASPLSSQALRSTLELPFVDVAVICPGHNVSPLRQQLRMPPDPKHVCVFEVTAKKVGTVEIHVHLLVANQIIHSLECTLEAHGGSGVETRRLSDGRRGAQLSPGTS